MKAFSASFARATEQAAGSPSGADRELRTTAHGTLSYGIAGAVGALLTFVATALVAHMLPVAGTGSFFEALAIYAVAAILAVWGADYGVTKFIPSLRSSPFSVLPGALLPVVIWSVVLTVVVWFSVPVLGSQLRDHIHHFDPTGFLTLTRTLSLFVLPSAVGRVLVAATRACGHMSPTVIYQSTGPQILRATLIVALAVSGNHSAVAVGVAWGAPSAVACVGAGLFMFFKVPRTPLVTSQDANEEWSLSRFWSFTAFRGIAEFVQYATIWIPILALAILSSQKQVAVYGAVSRFAFIGALGGQAALLIITPQAARLWSHGDRESIQRIYSAVTSWLIITIVPAYMVIAILPGTFLGVFGAPYRTGSTALTILCLFMLINVATGPAADILLMLGSSKANFFNSCVSLALTFGLSIALIPRFGVIGAAIAWGSAIAADNILPTWQIWRQARLTPVGPGLLPACLASIPAIAIVGVVSRLSGFSALQALSTTVVSGLAVYGIVVWHARESLGLAIFRTAAATRRSPR